MSETVPRDEAFLLRYLQAHEGVSCPLCRNRLGEMAGAVCPHCGERLILGIGVANPYLRAWLTTAAALLLGAGMGVLVLLVTLSESWPTQLWMRVVLSYFIANIPMAAVFVTFRRRFLRLRRAVQWSIAIPLGILTLVMFLLLFVLMT